SPVYACQTLFRSLTKNEVYPFPMAIELRAEHDVVLERQMEEVISWLGSCTLDVIGPDDDLYRLDNYLRHIPAGYDFRLDQIKRRNRLIYAQHLANILPRSEEHTSELQSRENLVCRLLLEKKNT